MSKEIHETNRVAWNEATKAHNSHKGDQAKFLREGGSTLFPEESGLLGDLNGKTLLHLQCNAGQDTLSIVKQHGATATGVDISDEAISFAQKLSQDSGIPAAFIRDDVYDFLEHSAEQFDVVFMSYGTIIWLTDLQRWANGVAKVLKSGGRFILVEFHPIFAVFEEVDGQIKPLYDYGTGEAMHFEHGIGDYVADAGEMLTQGIEYHEGVQGFVNPHASYEMNWGIDHVITALAEAGLMITHLKEYPYTNGFRPLSSMQVLEGRRSTWPEGFPKIPLMFSVAAKKL